MLLKPGSKELIFRQVDIQILKQCGAGHCHSRVKVNIYMLLVLKYLGVAAVIPPVLPVSVRPFRHREEVTNYFLWQVARGKNEHSCNS